MPTVSLCMIARNEAARLEACLLSVRGLVQEIVVVDTGSEDGTAAIAKRHGAAVYRCGWNDHFGEARNIALKRTSGDWILVLDADERLEASDAEFRGLLDDESTAGYALTVRNYRSADPDDYETDSVVRLFRNLPGLSYRGRIHEEIAFSMKRQYPQLTIKQAPLIVHHDGYAGDERTAAAKSLRNRRLLERAIREEDDKLYYKYALGAESFLQEQYADAVLQLEPLLRLVPPSAGYYADLAYKLAYAQWRGGNIAAARQTAETALAFEPGHADLLELHGSMLLDGHELEAALHRFLALKEARGEADWRLGLVHSRLLNASEALRCWDACLRSRRLPARALPLWLDLAFACCGDEELAARIELLLGTDRGELGPGAHAQLCRHAIKWRRGPLLLPFFPKAADSGSQEIAVIIAVCLAQSGETEAAGSVLERLLRQEAAKRQALIYAWALDSREAADTGGLDEFAVAIAGRSAADADREAVRQTAFAMLLMEAWDGFRLVWRLAEGTNGAEEEKVPSTWRPSLLAAPSKVRKEVFECLYAAGGGRSFGERLFAALLAGSIGETGRSRELFSRLREEFPRHVEPIIGLSDALAGEASAVSGRKLLLALH